MEQSIRVSIFTAMALTAIFARAALPAEERAPRGLPKGGGIIGASVGGSARQRVEQSVAPRSERADAGPASCPYHFGNDMPEATFCVYQGVAFGGRGEVCATGVVVMWSSFASPAAAIVERAERQSGSNSVSKRKVYLAFVTEPEVVLWANVESERGDRADMVAYTLGSDDAPQLLAGRMTLRAKRAGSADVLSMDLREPRRWQPGDCVFASYSGTFLGMIHSPSETTTAADAFVAPRR